MSTGFFLGVLALVGLAIYLKMYAKNRHWHLDENGVLKEEFIGSYSFLDIKKNDFEWIQGIFKKYFPDGHCTIKEYGLDNRHILIVNTSLYHHQYYIRNEDSDELMAHGSQNVMNSIFYIEQSLKEDHYYFYLRRPCSINVGQDEIIFKGRILQGSIANLKQGFDEWQRDQKTFSEKHQGKINMLKNQILSKQKEYDFQVYKFPEL